MARRTKYDWKLALAQDKDKAAQGLMHEVLRECHPSLRDQTIWVIFKPRGAVQVAVATPRERLLKGVSGFVILSWEPWQNMDDKQKAAQMDHLLSFFEVNDKTGSLVLVKPDIQEFTAVLSRRGAYTQDLRFFVMRAQQVVLPGMEESAGEAVNAAVSEANEEPPNGEIIEVLAEDPAFLRAARDMCPTKKGQTVTMSTPGGKSVTLTSATRKEINARIKVQETTGVG
jgi:TusA-related sulfurtransferase